MEALALLCTLHADGPATLQRLRRGGCADLAAVEALPAEELARLVGVSASAARRLAREACLLRERLAPGDADALLDREEAPEAIEQAQRPNAALDENDRALIQRVLTRPRPGGPELEERAGNTELEERASNTELEGRASNTELEERVGATLPEAPADQAPLADERGTGGDDTLSTESVEPAAASAPSETQAPEPVGTPLTQGTVDGLASAELATLASAEVTTLEELAAADVGTLARATGLPFSSIARWVFLARRGGRLPEPPAQDAPFGTGIEEAEGAAPAVEADAEPVEAASPEATISEPTITQAAAASSEREAVETEAPYEAAQVTSDGFGACIFEEPVPATTAPSAAPTSAETTAFEAPAAPAAAEHLATPQVEHIQPAAPVEADPATEVIWDAELVSSAAPEPPAMEAFESPVPITEDPTVRPPFWQVRAAWRGQQDAAPASGARAAVAAAPSAEARAVGSADAATTAADGAAPSDGVMQAAESPAAEAPAPEQPSALQSRPVESGSMEERATEHADLSAAQPAAAVQDDTSLGWDFVIPSRREVGAKVHGQDPAADQPAEGIGGPFA